MEQDPEVRLIQDRHLLSWDQLVSFRADPFMIMIDQKERATQAVEKKADEEGVSIESMEITVEIHVKAYAK